MHHAGWLEGEAEQASDGDERAMGGTPGCTSASSQARELRGTESTEAQREGRPAQYRPGWLLSVRSTRRLLQSDEQEKR
jgi:hypothetical protein